MDQDGENHQFLTNGNFLVLTPRFSPSTQEITYLAYYNNEPRVGNVNVVIQGLPDTNQFEIEVIFEIIGIDLPIQNFTFILEI